MASYHAILRRRQSTPSGMAVRWCQPLLLDGAKMDKEVFIKLISLVMLKCSDRSTREELRQIQDEAVRHGLNNSDYTHMVSFGAHATDIRYVISLAERMGLNAHDTNEGDLDIDNDGVVHADVPNTEYDNEISSKNGEAKHDKTSEPDFDIVIWPLRQELARTYQQISILEDRIRNRELSGEQDLARAHNRISALEVQTRQKEQELSNAQQRIMRLFAVSHG